MALDKGDGLGVLPSYDEIAFGLTGIRKALRNRDRERGIKDALNNVKDLTKRLNKSRKDARQLQKKTKGLIKELTNKVLPLIEESKSGGKRNT